MKIRHTGLLYGDPKRSTPGYVLISPVDGDQVYLLDPAGEVAHQWQTGGGMTNWCYLLLSAAQRQHSGLCQWRLYARSASFQSV